MANPFAADAFVDALELRGNADYVRLTTGARVEPHLGATLRPGTEGSC